MICLMNSFYLSSQWASRDKKGIAEVTVSLVKYFVEFMVSLTISLTYRILEIRSTYFSESCNALKNIFIRFPDSSCKQAFPPPKMLAGHS